MKRAFSPDATSIEELFIAGTHALHVDVVEELSLGPDPRPLPPHHSTLDGSLNLPGGGGGGRRMKKMNKKGELVQRQGIPTAGFYPLPDAPAL